MLLTSVILGTSFVPVSANDIAVEYNAAIKDIVEVGETIIVEDDLTAEDHFELGRKFSKEEKYSEAVEEFSKTIELDMTLLDAYYSRGSAYAKLEKYPEAVYIVGIRC